MGLSKKFYDFRKSKLYKDREISKYTDRSFIEKSLLGYLNVGMDDFKPLTFLYRINKKEYRIVSQQIKRGNEYIINSLKELNEKYNMYFHISELLMVINLHYKGYNAKNILFLLNGYTNDEYSKLLEITKSIVLLIIGKMTNNDSHTHKYTLKLDDENDREFYIDYQLFIIDIIKYEIFANKSNKDNIIKFMEKVTLFNTKSLPLKKMMKEAETLFYLYFFPNDYIDENFIDEFGTRNFFRKPVFSHLVRNKYYENTKQYHLLSDLSSITVDLINKKKVRPNESFMFLLLYVLMLKNKNKFFENGHTYLLINLFRKLEMLKECLPLIKVIINFGEHNKRIGDNIRDEESYNYLKKYRYNKLYRKDKTKSHVYYNFLCLYLYKNYKTNLADRFYYIIRNAIDYSKREMTDIERKKYLPFFKILLYANYMKNIDTKYSKYEKHLQNMIKDIHELIDMYNGIEEDYLLLYKNNGLFTSVLEDINNKINIYYKVN